MQRASLIQNIQAVPMAMALGPTSKTGDAAYVIYRRAMLLTAWPARWPPRVDDRIAAGAPGDLAGRPPRI
jgi:hypothetical protein